MCPLCTALAAHKKCKIFDYVAIYETWGRRHVVSSFFATVWCSTSYHMWNVRILDYESILVILNVFFPSSIQEDDHRWDYNFLDGTNQPKQLQNSTWKLTKNFKTFPNAARKILNAINDSNSQDNDYDHFYNGT